MIARDQYGTTLVLKGKHPRKELMEEFDTKRAVKIYQDKRDGTAVHIGYIVRGHWFTLYTRWERPA